MARKSPQKTCPSCGVKVHVRKSTCDCGHVFYQKKGAATPKKAPKPVKAVTVSTAVTKPNRKKAPLRVHELIRVLTPAGECPVKPDFKGDMDAWAQNPALVNDWIQKVQAAGVRQNRDFALSACRYWLHGLMNYSTALVDTAMAHLS